MLRVRGGWIAALLLIALAFLGGPDLLHEHPPSAKATATSAVERDNRAGEDLDSPVSVSEHLALGRRRMPGLPPSQDNTRPAAVTGHAGADRLGAGPSGSIADGHLTHGSSGCSPESLQVFRC
ncbi:hypothetical protein GCM10023196_056970 [Actinoallomurus vinaceus]|uniref:Secreted protein n=1 Tax=Actinoallomurus vinaceus TaxID=1080074 RepID=A0ABP8UF53_9ACTN